MKISELIAELEKAMAEHGDADTDISGLHWYNFTLNGIVKRYLTVLN